MNIKDFQKVYCTPKARVVKVGIMSVLCGSPYYAGNSSTEQLEEQDVSESIW